MEHDFGRTLCHWVKWVKNTVEHCLNIIFRLFMRFLIGKISRCLRFHILPAELDVVHESNRFNHSRLWIYPAKGRQLWLCGARTIFHHEVFQLLGIGRRTAHGLCGNLFIQVKLASDWSVNDGFTQQLLLGCFFSNQLLYLFCFQITFVLVRTHTSDTLYFCINRNQDLSECRIVAHVVGRYSILRND